jgi:hypothetical protein
MLTHQTVEQLDRRVLAGIHRKSFHRRMIEREIFIAGVEILDDRIDIAGPRHDFQNTALAFEDRRRSGEANLRQQRGAEPAATGHTVV